VELVEERGGGMGGISLQLECDGHGEGEYGAFVVMLVALLLQF
jgi:hypothetical protein